MKDQASAIGATRISGKDAQKLISQLRYGRPKQAAHQAAARGRAMLEEFNRNGSVVVSAQHEAFSKIHASKEFTVDAAHEAFAGAQGVAWRQK